MRYAKPFLTVAMALLSAGLWAQESHHFRDPDVLARFSYESSPAVQGEGVRHLCVAISREGEYRVTRKVDAEPMQWLHGRMSQPQFTKLRMLLSNSDFRDVAGSHGWIMRQAGESFAAEILRSAGTQRFQWLSVDDENPFPASVAKLVSWLKHFDPAGAVPFSYAEYPDVCPSGGVRLLEPPIATK